MKLLRLQFSPGLVSAGAVLVWLILEGKLIVSLFLFGFNSGPQARSYRLIATRPLQFFYVMNFIVWFHLMQTGLFHQVDLIVPSYS